MLKKLRGLFIGQSQENDANDELRFHLEKEVEQNIALGMSAEEARRKALIAFGGVQQTREALREVHRSHLLESLLQDVRYGWRMLRKSPAFTIIAVLTLALGIGANSAIFSLINAVAFRNMPIPDPQHMVFLEWHANHRPNTVTYWSFGDCEDNSDGPDPQGCSLPLPFFRDIQQQATVFSHVAAYTGREQLDLSGNGPARIIQNQFVSGDYFGTIGIHAHLGRLFSESDDTPEASPVTILNYGFWQSAFGGSPSAIGRTIRLNGTIFTIIGVTEPKFDALTLSDKFDTWVPLAKRSLLAPQMMLNAGREQMDSWWLVMIARLKPGIPVTQAQEAISLMFRNEMIKGDKPIFKADNEPRIRLGTASQGLGGSQKDTLQPLYVMMLCVGVVLLIACANVAGLLLARSAARQKEMAVRLALGAKRGRLVLQMLTESLLLSVGGGALGLLLTVWGTHALTAMASDPVSNQPALTSHVDWRVLAFTAGISILTGIVFGLAPALRGSDIGLTSSLKSGGGRSSTASGSRRITLGGALVAVQMALAIVVLVTAGLLTRTLSNLKNLDPGFDTHSVLLFGIDPRLAGYKGQQVDNLFRDLQDKFSALPGVTSASYSLTPLLTGALNTNNFHRPGAPKDSKDNVDADSLPIGPRFFSTMHVPFLNGHDFTQADYAVAESNTGDKPSSQPTPVIVNQEFIRMYFSGRNPIGERFADAEPTEPGETRSPGYTIVGVVANAKYNQLRREIKPTFYSPQIGNWAYFELRTAVDPLTLVPSIKRLVNSANEDLALFQVSTQTQAIDQQVLNERLTAQLSSFFGLVALVLACIGLYGLLSYEVSRRTREIGIRMAIGAQSHNVVRLVLAKALVLIVAGAVSGIAVALGVTRLLTSFLFGVKAGDPVTLVSVIVLLTAVALAACYIPARRATKVDPLVALRYE
jgi:predicted permease